jgi:hypothetical protein
VFNLPKVEEDHDMLKKYLKFLIWIPSITFVGTMLSCATDRLPLATQNSLPQNELAYYSDSFEKMREDLWERAGYVYHEEQVQNFRQADMRFGNGKLIICSKTGSFSKGGLASKYSLRGDFDIQLDCRMDFIKGLSGGDMDQVIDFAVFDSNLEMGKISSVRIGLSMKGGAKKGLIFSNSFTNGKGTKGGFHEIGNFSGTLRIWRTGQDISTLYKKAGTVDWIHMKTFRVTDDDMIIGIQVRNFFVNRTTIRANNSVTAEFHSFKINAAQAIVEEEI